jgi:hypothetical protein
MEARGSKRLPGKEWSLADMDKWVAGEKRSVPRRHSGSRGTSFGLCPGHPSSQVLRSIATNRMASQNDPAISRRPNLPETKRQVCAQKNPRAKPGGECSRVNANAGYRCWLRGWRTPLRLSRSSWPCRRRGCWGRPDSSGVPTARPRPGRSSAGGRWLGRSDGLHRGSLRPRRLHTQRGPGLKCLRRKAGARPLEPGMQRLANLERLWFLSYSLFQTSPPVDPGWAPCPALGRATYRYAGS